MKINTRTIVAIGIGSAVFYVLNRFVSIPSGIPNTSINTAYAFLAFMSTVFGPLAGALIGFIGHTLTDATMYGSVWWSWVVVSAFVGCAVGLCQNKVNVEDGDFNSKDLLFFNLYQIAANIIGWGVLAPVLDILIYKEPADKVFLQGLTAGAANLITVAILGSVFLTLYAKTRTSAGSLSKE
ncbi:MAG: ECF-type riboflavin transporter substrate-binding protein [Flexilinea sp.]|nr:ECF-type riboflavin transporter substrate-binding protein [Flexilinea sp.]